MSIKENNKPLNDKSRNNDQQNTDTKPFLAINTMREIYMPKKQNQLGSQRLKMPNINKMYSPPATSSNIDINFKPIKKYNPLLASAILSSSIDSSD